MCREKKFVKVLVKTSFLSLVSASFYLDVHKDSLCAPFCEARRQAEYKIEIKIKGKKNPF